MLTNNSDQPSFPYAGDHFADFGAMLMGVIVFFFALCLLVSTYQRAHVAQTPSAVTETR